MNVILVLEMTDNKRSRKHNAPFWYILLEAILFLHHDTILSLNYLKTYHQIDYFVSAKFGKLIQNDERFLWF